MKKKLYLLAFLTFLLSFLCGCNAAEGENSEKDLQRLSQLELYQDDGTLISTITDKDILSKFNSILIDIGS